VAQRLGLVPARNWPAITNGWETPLYGYTIDGQYPADLLTEQGDEWLAGLQELILSILSRFIPVESIALYLSHDNMQKFWRTAFTHITWDLNDNYERLEFVGDKILDSTLPLYFLEIMPGTIKQNNGTQLHNQYSGNFFLNQLGSKYHIADPGHIRMGVENATTLSAVSDVMEAFIGALYNIGDQSRPGQGFVDCQQLTRYWYHDEPIDLEYGRQSAKTRVVTGLLGKFSFPQPHQRWSKTADGQKLVQLETPREAIDFYKEAFQIELPPVIGWGQGFSDRAAENAAFQMAADAMDKFGITEQQLADWRTSIDYRKLGSTLAGQLQEVAKLHGYSNPHFLKAGSAHNKKGSIVLLVGKLPTGRLEKLGAIYVPGERADDMPSKVQLAQQYVTSGGALAPTQPRPPAPVTAPLPAVQAQVVLPTALPVPVSHVTPPTQLQ
jgi:dsRNA-specific ribonuclease